MKRIPLTQGQFALVDDEDFERLSQFKWCAWWSQWTKSYYAVRHGRCDDGKYRTVYMAREIMGAKLGEKVDHKFHNTLDNRRENLRICTTQQNSINSRMRSDNTSGLKGVSWNKNAKKWQAYIANGNRKRIHLGYFVAALDAARAYDAEALRINSEFSLTNKMLGLIT